MNSACYKPEWADNELCPIDTGEIDDCKDCYWFFIFGGQNDL